MFIDNFYVSILMMSNRWKNKVTDNIEVSPIPTIRQTKTKPKPKPKHEFTEAVREGWEKYQEQRDENKILTHLNKKYSTKTISRREALKQKLINNPIFINDYKRILDA